MFELFGINVFVHWSWLLLVAVAVQLSDRYTLKVWMLAELMALFGIVLMHEFGHALACRSVGGQANRIMLWPLGGVAFVQPPARPGALMWSIVGGPLVNVVLVPVTGILFMLSQVSEGLLTLDAYTFVQSLTFINLALLVFNMLPIYPLDGGQILQSLLWFVVGRSKSLHIAAAFGLAFGLAGGMAALFVGELWFVLLAVFIVMRSWQGFQAARVMARMESVGLGHLVDERKRV